MRIIDEQQYNFANMAKQTGTLFFLTIVLFIVQYIQPEETFSFLEVIKPHLLMTALVALCLFFGKEDVFQWKHSQMKIFWLFLGLMAVLNYFSADPETGGLYVKYMLSYGVFMVALILSVTNTERLKTFIDIMIVTALVIAFRGFLTMEGMYNAPFFSNGNFFTDPNAFSLYMNVMLPFSYFSMVSEKNFLKRMFYLASGGVFLLGVVLSFSRGGFIGLLAVLTILFWYSPYKKQALIIVFLSFIGMWMIAPPEWKEEMSTSTDTSESTASARLSLWESSVDIFVNHPLGVGPANTPLYITEHPNVDTPYVSHSIWFTTMADLGIIGCVLFLWIIVRNFKDVLKIIRYDNEHSYIRLMALACLVSLIGFMATGSFLTVNYYPHMWYITAIILVLCSLYEEKRGEQ